MIDRSEHRILVTCQKLTNQISVIRRNTMKSFFSKIVFCCTGSECPTYPARRASMLVPRSLPLEQDTRSEDGEVELNAPTVIVVDIDSWESDETECSSTKCKTKVDTETLNEEAREISGDVSEVTVSVGSVQSTNQAAPPVSNKTSPFPKLDMMEYTFSGNKHETNSRYSQEKPPQLRPVSIFVSSPSGTSTIDYRYSEAREECGLVSPPVLQHVPSGVSGRVVARLNGKRARVGGAWKKRKLKRTDLKSSAHVLNDA